jgi:hypothetical protein
VSKNRITKEDTVQSNKENSDFGQP